MSAAEHQSPNDQSQQRPLSPPPQRPSLQHPPARPSAPATDSSPPAVPPPPAAAPAMAAPASQTSDAGSVADTPTSTFKNHPIAPPSEPMQYRAIGLVRGTYQPSEEQLNRGNILTDDGTLIDAVLLGRVTSLIKKHIDLESSHLWVVYPRTRQAFEKPEETESEDDNAAIDNGALHLQIVGVWEPETLGLPGENPNTESSEDEDEAASGETGVAVDTPAEADAAAADTDETVVPTENYFSIRGEVINYDDDDEQILVKIVQGAKRSGKPPKAFKLNVGGKISGKTVGYFWELDVERQGENLTLTSAQMVGIVPPKKRKKRGGKPFGPKRGGGRRPHGQEGSPKPRPTRSKDKPRIRPSSPVKSNPL